MKEWEEEVGGKLYDVDKQNIRGYTQEDKKKLAKNVLRNVNIWIGI